MNKNRPLVVVAFVVNPVLVACLVSIGPGPVDAVRPGPRSVPGQDATSDGLPREETFAARDARPGPVQGPEPAVPIVSVPSDVADPTTVMLPISGPGVRTYFHHLLVDIERVDRAEQVLRWRRIDCLGYCQSWVNSQFRSMARQGGPADEPRHPWEPREGIGELTRYQQYVAAAQLAGFGKPTKNWVFPRETRLKDCLSQIKGGSYPPGRARLIRWDPAINDLAISLPAPRVSGKERDYLHEVLWGVLEKHSLNFVTLSDDTFYIYPRPSTYMMQGSVLPPSPPQADGATPVWKPSGFPKEDVESLLRDIEKTGWRERRKRSEALDRLARDNASARERLFSIASGLTDAGPYRRYAACLVVVGLGSPHIMVPTHSYDEPFPIYIEMLRAIHPIRDRKGLLRYDPALDGLRFTVPDAAEFTLDFQETLWEIITKYHLNFRLLPTGAFFLSPGDMPLPPGRPDRMTALTRDHDRDAVQRPFAAHFTGPSVGPAERPVQSGAAQ